MGLGCYRDFGLENGDFLAMKMNTFWRGGICLRSYTEHCPLQPRDKIGDGSCSHDTFEIRNSLATLESLQDQRPSRGKIGPLTIVNVTLKGKRQVNAMDDYDTCHEVKNTQFAPHTRIFTPLLERV
jgi:hypothetical protein